MRFWVVVVVGLLSSPEAVAFRSPMTMMSHAVIVQNKGGGHGEIGYQLAKKLVGCVDKVTLLQDEKASKTALPFSRYESDLVGVDVVWCSLSDAEVASKLSDATHCFDNYSKDPSDSAVFASACAANPSFQMYTYISSAGMYTTKGILKETQAVKEESGQRKVEVSLSEALPGRWCAFRPQYIYGPFTNKRDYLDWFLARAARDAVMAVPGDAQQPVSVTHSEDVAALLASVIGKEDQAKNEVFNCGTDKLCTYNEVCAAAARGLKKEHALVATLDPLTKSSFPFRPNAEGFAVRVAKAKDLLGWPGAQHNVLDDLCGFYRDDFLKLGLDQGDLDTSKDMLDQAATLDYVPV